MKLYGLMLAGLFMSVSMAAQSDPFVGTWVYNAQKSPKPTITYGIKDLGGDRYALTGSTGETTEIRADGVSIKSPSGATVSFKKLDDHTWQMDRGIESRTMLRTYSVSADDKTLTLHDVFTAPDGSMEELTTMYARAGPGKSIFGEWKSFSMEEAPSGKPDKLVIQPYGKDGLTFIWADKHRTDMNFDGKQYFDVAPDGTKGDSSSGKRISANLIQMEGQNKGKPEDNQELKVSDDGKTLTIVNKFLKTSAVFTSVWDKQ